MEKVHPWCGQLWDRGRLRNRTGLHVLTLHVDWLWPGLAPGQVRSSGENKHAHTCITASVRRSLLNVSSRIDSNSWSESVFYAYTCGDENRRETAVV